MPDRRAWRLDLAALLLFAAGALAALALCSYDPADLPGQVYPPRPAPRNLLGAPGAYAAHAVVQALGVAAYVWLGAWLALVLLLLRRRDWPRGPLRLAGWLLLVPAAAAAADRWGAAWPGATPFGAGGAAGAWLNLWFEERLRPEAQVAVLGAALALGLVLAGGFLVRRLAWRLWRLAALLGRGLAGAWRAVRGAARLFRRRQRPAPVLEVRGLPAPPIRELAPPGEERAAGAGDVPIRHHEEPLPPAAPEGEVGAPDLRNGVRSERERFADFELPPLTLLEDPKPLALGDHEQR